MIVAKGSVAIDLNMSRLVASGKQAKSGALRYEIEPDSFFKVLVLNDEFRGALPSSMSLISQNSLVLPAPLNAAYKQFTVESLAWGDSYELVVRDARNGSPIFNIEGHQFDYEPASQTMNISMGRLLISKELAVAMGRPSEAGSVIGQINITATMKAIEISQLVDGEVDANVLPASPETGTVPGPDVVVGDLSGLAQFGSQSGSQVGLAIGTDSCNFGTIDLNWFQNPNNDHPVIPQNMYRMSGGATNDERFEQIGQSHVKHAFTALTLNICNLGCNGVGGSRLGSGCSDPYGASLNAGPNLGSRAFINPFSGFYPRNDSATPNNSHAGHTHLGPSHRILTEVSDLIPAQNPGATYYAEGQYITPHEYAWCQANPGQCNMYNNVSYRRYNVNNSASPFSFSPVGSTVRAKPAIEAWAGATLVQIHPAPGQDGIGFVGYKVTNPSPGVWHYEYAIYNQNIDRAIGSFSVPFGSGASLSNVGFHAPPQHPGWSNDGTVGNAGFSSSPWGSSQANGEVTWTTESFAVNQNANAIRWGTLYNFRFDSNRPPATVNATIGFFKTGSPITVQVQGPSAVAPSNISISGRVTTPGGIGIGNVNVVLHHPNGSYRFVNTNPFGYYTFEDVATGLTYQMEVASKRFTFPPPVQVTPTGNITDMNFESLP